MDFTYLTNLKNDFQEQLIPILSSNIYRELKGMFKYSEDLYPKLKIRKKDITLQDVFRKTLSGFETINNHQIEKLYYTLKGKSGCSEFFDNLVVASFKSYILFLSWDPETQSCRYSDNEYFKNISVTDFVHKCYVISASYFNQHCDVFESRNKKEILEAISSCIKIAMIRMIPYNEICSEYIENNFSTHIANQKKEISQIREVVNRFVERNRYGNIPDNVMIEENNSDGNYDVQDFINKQRFAENLSNKNFEDPIQQYEENKESDIIESFNSKDMAKDRMIDEIIGDNDTVEIDKTPEQDLNVNLGGNTGNTGNTSGNNTPENNTGSNRSNNIEHNNESNNSNNSNNLNNSNRIQENEPERQIVLEPPAIRGKNTLEQLGAKTKFKVVSNKRASDKRMKEMDNFFEQLV